MTDIKKIENLKHLVGTSYERYFQEQEKLAKDNSITRYSEGIEQIDFDEDEYAEAFESLRNDISTNSNAAKNGDVVNISDKYADYWTDNPLKFTKDDKTGQYLIEQMDSDGNWVAMGWTTREVAAEYADKVSKIQKESENVKSVDVETSAEKHACLQQEAMDKKESETTQSVDVETSTSNTGSTVSNEDVTNLFDTDEISADRLVQTNSDSKPPTLTDIVTGSADRLVQTNSDSKPPTLIDTVTGSKE